MQRSHSALGRLEGQDDQQLRGGARQARRRQSATGPLRRGLHHTNRTTEAWAANLRLPDHTVAEYWPNEQPRNRPHPSEEFLLRQMPVTRRTASLGEALFRHTKESFYEDYSTLYSNSGDAGNEVQTQLVRLPYRAETYRNAAKRELAYNPPYPNRLMYGHSSSREMAQRKVKSTERKEEAELPDISSKQKESSRQRTPLPSKGGETNGSGMTDTEREALQSAFKGHALPGVEKWMKTASAKERQIAVDVLKKATGQSEEDRSATKPKVTIQDGAREGATSAGAAKDEEQQSCLQETHPEAIKPHHHHHHTSGSCQRCDRRRIEKDYKTLSGSTRLREEFQHQVLPGTSPKPRTLKYRLGNSAHLDPATNARTFFLASQPAHRSHFSIAPDWPSELVDKQLSGKKRTTKKH